LKEGIVERRIIEGDEVEEILLEKGVRSDMSVQEN